MSDSQPVFNPSTMTPAQAHAKAVLWIEAAAQTGRYWLNLENLPLAAVPQEIEALSGQLKALEMGISSYAVFLHYHQKNIHHPLQDITALSALASLQKLYLKGCAQLTDLAPLHGLTSLQSLHLNDCVQLSNLDPLRGMIELQSLFLNRCNQITDISPLHGLTALQSLDLSDCKQLADLGPLQGLTALHSLDLSNCNQLTDLGALHGLTGLQFLRLSNCYKLTDIAPLRGLISLRSLNLNVCNKVTDLVPLQALTALHSLYLSYWHQLTDIAYLRGLAALQDLDLTWCIRLTDIAPIRGLAALRYLNLNYCRQLTDLAPVLALSKLSRLYLYDTGGAHKQDPAQLLSRLPQLETLSCDRLSGTPAEVLSQTGLDNCLPRLRAWLADLEQGEADSHDLKLFFLGNGRVGKSELFRRLRGEDFHGKLETTHGIQLGRFELGRHSDGKPIFCNAWDFGGQDIYLGTHALFLKSRALFVLAWHPKMETDAPYTEAVSGLEMRHRPLRYWLDYIHALAGEEARVIVVQTQCATQHDKRRPDLGDTSRFAWIEATVSCAERDNGVDALCVLLQQAAEHRLEQPAPPRMPASWLAVRDRLFELRATEKTIDRARFDALCAQTHHGASAAALLHYLHHAGDVFHQDDVFGGAIVLDQQWALDGIYAIFQREKVLKMLLRHHGRVHADDFDVAVWHERFSPQEQALLLSMMERCDLIFRLYGDGDDTQYAMVDALPAADAKTATLPERWRPGPRYSATLHYDFLHEGILRAWIAGIGREAKINAQYWRYGTEFHDTRTDSDAWMQAEISHDGSGRIVLITQGEAAQQLRETLIERFARIRIGQPPNVERNDPPGSAPTVAPRDDEDASQQIVVARRSRRPDDKPEVYISYARGGKDRPELRQFGEDLHIALQECFTVHRDERSLKPGDSIDEFMERIGCGARVLVVMSRRYLISRYCMQESERLHSRHGGRRDKMRKCILPLVVDPALQLDDCDIMATADHWRGKVDELDRWLTGKAQDEHLIMRQRLGRYRKIAGIADNMLDFLSDTVMPRDEAELRANDFVVVKDALRRLPGADAPP